MIFIKVKKKKKKYVYKIVVFICRNICIKYYEGRREVGGKRVKRNKYINEIRKVSDIYVFVVN